ncbi:uncharacterized protein LOC125047267 [Penaeus chinensis]|uniref:uncharacterized protein LOC125047267 n=1 Tax=Penaeus chinensis TaxID=139456 RepID=UPI001FB738A3|nr:uncharacterized protein LOC125047267 [Penaeus chinensis]
MALNPLKLIFPSVSSMSDSCPTEPWYVRRLENICPTLAKYVRIFLKAKCIQDFDNQALHSPIPFQLLVLGTGVGLVFSFLAVLSLRGDKKKVSPSDARPQRMETAKVISEKGNADQQVSEKENADQQVSEKENADQQVSEKENADQQVSEKENVDQQVSEKENVDQQVSEKENADQQVSEKENADQQVSEKENADQ